MDTRKFDTFTKTLASGRSRRSVIGGLVGGALAMAGLSNAAGAPPKKPCPALHPDSSFWESCQNESVECTDKGMIVTASCPEAYEPWGFYPAQINVNTCKSKDYYIANCNGVLTCGECKQQYIQPQ